MSFLRFWRERVFQQPQALAQVAPFLPPLKSRRGQPIHILLTHYENRQRNASQARKQILDLIAAHPELLQGPIVASSEEAVLARPIENLRKLGTR